MSFLYNLSLQKKISFIVLAGLAVTLGLFGWIGVRAAQESTRRMLEERLSRAQLVAGYLDALLLHAVHDLRDLTTKPGITSPQEAPFNVAKIQRDFKEMGLNTHEVFATGKQGSVLWRIAIGPVVPGGPLPDLSGAFGDKYYHISDSMSGSDTGRPPTILLAVHSPSGEGPGGLTLGVIVDAMHWGAEGFLKPVTAGEKGYAEIVDGKGTVLSRSSPGLPPKADEVSDHPGKFSDLIREGQAVVSTCHRCHADETEVPRRGDVIAFAPLSMTSWGIGLRQPEEEALASVRDLQRQLLFFATLLAVAGLILVGSLTRSVVKPIKTLTLASKKIAGGDLEGNIVNHNRDEIGELSRTFDLMRLKLRSTQQELEQWNKGLEDTVRQRTAEISYQLEIARILGSTLALEPLLEKMMSKLTGFIRPVQGAAYLLFHDAGKKGLSVRATAGEAIGYGNLEAPFQKIAEEAFNSGLTQYNPCLNPAPAMSDMDDKRVASCVGAPIMTSSGAAGALLVIGRKNLDQVGPQEIRLIEATAQQMGVALEIARLHEKVEEMAVLQERDRMAREIHDGLAQTMAFLNLQIAAVRDQLVNRDLEKVRTELDKMAKATADAYDEVREIIVGLDSEAKLAQRVSDMGLEPVLGQVVSKFSEQSGISADLMMTRDGVGYLSFGVQVQLVRVVQEALNNIRKHAQATSAVVRLEKREKELALEIADNGRGFVPGVLPGEKHFGMAMMKGRVESLGGHLEIQSVPGAGARVLALLPLDHGGTAS